MALTAPRATSRLGLDPVPALLPPVPMAATTKIYAGGMVGVDASGRAIAGASGAVAILGVSERTVDNSAGTAAAIDAKDIRRGVFSFANKAADAVVQGDLFQTVYVEDDQTVRHTAGGGVAAGKFLGFNGTECWVQVGV